jgi:hypothetical protein
MSTNSVTGDSLASIDALHFQSRQSTFPSESSRWSTGISTDPSRPQHRGGGGKKMFLLLIDNFSRYMWIVLLPSMDGVLEAIK